MTLYHLTLSGAVAACNAQTKSCRYRDADHFATREAGKTALSQREAAGYKTPSMLRKSTVPAAGSIRELKVEARLDPCPESLGDHFLELVEETLPFSFSTVTLNHRVIEEAGLAVRDTYSSLAQSARPLKNRVRGVRPTEVKTSLTFVPDRVKTLLAREEIVSSWRTGRALVNCQELVPKVQVPGPVSKLGGHGPLAVDSDTGQTYWLGRPPRAVEGYRVASSYLVAGEGSADVVKVKEPIYALNRPDSVTASRIRIPNSSVSIERVEAILHGYSHIVQERIPWVDGKSLFEELATGQKYSSKLQSVVRMGFPTEALGVSGEELFPLSSSSFFFPEVGENYWILSGESRRLTLWTAGVWVRLAFCDLSSS